MPNGFTKANIRSFQNSLFLMHNSWAQSHQSSENTLVLVRHIDSTIAPIFLQSDILVFKDLVIFDIGVNMLTGTIPTEIVGLPGMQELWLEDNMLTGSLPTEVGMASNLSELSPSAPYKHILIIF